jgi:LacI family transcriptional regulator
VPNNSPGILEAVDHLAKLGHKHIAFLAGPSASWINKDRWNLLMTSAVAAGMTVVEISSDEPTLEGGRLALDRVRASGVSAVVAYNDVMGIGLLRAAAVAGIAVPEQLSIIGFDNIFGSDFTSPPLTTIEMPLEKVGANAVHSLLKSLKGEDQDEIPHGSEETTSLLVRGSTGKASA